MEISDPVLHKKQKTNRDRPSKSYTLSPETLNYLNDIVKHKEADCQSRAIDIIVQRHKDLADKVFVGFTSDKMRDDFMRKCFREKVIPSRVLAVCVEKIIDGTLSVSVGE